MSPAEVNLETAWNRAETYCYDQLLSATGTKDGKNAFQGYMPDPPAFDCWSFFSGGLGVGAITRFSGPNACWSTLGMQARVEVVRENRLHVLDFMGLIMRFLEENDNLRGKSNLQELRLADLPQEPEPIPIADGRIMWRCRLPLTLVYSTGTVFS